jgi:hypothetical protein
MTSGHFRHLPVVGDAGLVGIVDITDVCLALLDPGRPQGQQDAPTLAPDMLGEGGGHPDVNRLWRPARSERAAGER